MNKILFTTCQVMLRCEPKLLNYYMRFIFSRTNAKDVGSISGTLCYVLLWCVFVLCLCLFCFIFSLTLITRESVESARPCDGVGAPKQVASDRVRPAVLLHRLIEYCSSSRDTSSSSSSSSSSPPPPPPPEFCLTI
jgi:hypothetical protein